MQMFLFVTTLMFSVIIPDSLTLTQALGGSEADSGSMIGYFMLAGAIGSVFAIPIPSMYPKMWWERIKSVLTSTFMLLACGVALYLIVTVAVAGGHHQSHLWRLLIAARMTGGFAYGLGTSLLWGSFPRMVPPEKQIPATTTMMLFHVTGIGLGPLVASFARVPSAVADHFADRHVESRDDVVAVAVMSLAMLCTQVYIVSTKCPSLEEEPNHECSVDEEAKLQFNGTTDFCFGQRAFLCCTLIMGAMRSYIVSSLEVATADILEKDFLWKLFSIGIAIGLTFLTFVPLKLSMETFRLYATNTTLVRCLLGISVVGTIFLFSPEGLFHSVDAKSASLLFGDVLVFPSIFVSDALIRGLQSRLATPTGTLFSIENLSPMMNLLNMGARFLGPWLARLSLELGNQAVYAATQLGTCVFCLLIFELGVRTQMDRCPK